VFVVYEMVHCACELSGRSPVDHLTFGEFCILVTSLRQHYARKFVSFHSMMYYVMDVAGIFVYIKALFIKISKNS